MLHSIGIQLPHGQSSRCPCLLPKRDPIFGHWGPSPWRFCSAQWARSKWPPEPRSQVVYLRSHERRFLDSGTKPRRPFLSFLAIEVVGEVATSGSGRSELGFSLCRSVVVGRCGGGEVSEERVLKWGNFKGGGGGKEEQFRWVGQLPGSSL